MTRGFEANVPARKPRTISRVISELTAGPAAGAEDSKHLPAVDEGALARDLSASGFMRQGADDIVHTPTPAEVAPAAPVKRTARVESGGRERIAKLRDRLAVTAHVPTGAAEPKQTAAAVRDMIEALRTRLEAAIEDRSRLAAELEDARAAAARGEAELRRERKARASLEAQAEERRRIADDAVAEAEALAAERDQVLEEIAELRRLEDQGSLLQEAEAALADLEVRLQEAQSGRTRAEARGAELEAEVARLSAAGEALEALEALMRRGR